MKLVQYLSVLVLALLIGAAAYLLPPALITARDNQYFNAIRTERAPVSAQNSTDQLPMEERLRMVARQYSYGLDITRQYVVAPGDLPLEKLLGAVIQELTELQELGVAPDISLETGTYQIRSDYLYLQELENRDKAIGVYQVSFIVGDTSHLEMTVDAANGKIYSLFFSAADLDEYFGNFQPLKKAEQFAKYLGLELGTDSYADTTGSYSAFLQCSVKDEDYHLDLFYSIAGSYVQYQLSSNG